VSLRIEIDLGACTGHGRCYSLAPDLFDADDEGRPVVLDAAADEHRAEALAAAGTCPERAITLTDPARSSG
jgi:ferredoxin